MLNFLDIHPQGEPFILSSLHLILVFVFLIGGVILMYFWFRKRKNKRNK